MSSDTRTSAANAQEITNIVSDILVEHAAARPRNTTKQYAPKQAEFKEWCLMKKYDDGCLVHEGKLVTFLKTFVIPRGNKRKKTESGEALPLSMASIEAYAKAVIDLYKLQQSLKTNTHPHPRGKAYHDLFDTLKRKETERKRKNYADRGLGTVLDGYNMEDMSQLSELWLLENNGAAIRDRADFLLGHALLARGETRRFIEFPDLLTLELPDEGLQMCTPLVVIMNRGKTNQHGRIEYGAALRCKNEMICPLNAVACHLFWRWQVDLESFPDVSRRESWYDIHLINGANPTTEISYNTQLTRVKRAFEACGIDSTVWTHANRGSGAKLAETYGANEEQIRRLGRWNAARMEGCYLTSLPKKAMRALAGFPTKGGSYWLPRGAVVPSKALQQLVYPDVERAEQLLAEGQTREIAAGAFLRMLKHMRVVFLQDSVSLRRKYPAHRMWKHPLFASAEYLSFDRELSTTMSTTTKPDMHTLETVVPHIASILSENFKALHGRIDAVAADVDSLQALAKRRLVLSVEDVDGCCSTSAVIDVCSRATSREPPTAVSESAPALRMSRSIRTVVDLWREYTTGLAGQMSIREADEKLGSKWRQHPTEARFYLRRKKYYVAVSALAAKDGISPEEAATRLEHTRVQTGLSLNAFTAQLAALHKD